MRSIRWVRKYPLTAIMILCWFAGGAYFGSSRLYTLMNELRERPQVSEQILAMTPKGKVSTVIQIDRQNTSEDKEAAERALAEAAEAERKKHPFSKVEQSYLDDAVFIGDSRTDTLRLYADWGNATYYVKTGTNIWSIMDDQVTVGKKTMSIEKALQQKSFGKVYIMLGVNELGTGTAESFYQEFKNVVDRIRELQPDALIFVQSIMHVSSSVDRSSRIVTNEAINSRNKLLQKLADNDMIYYIDENEALDDENHALTASYTYDGIHLQAKYVQPWKDFILAHGVVKPSAAGGGSGNSGKTAEKESAAAEETETAKETEQVKETEPRSETETKKEQESETGKEAEHE